MKRLSWKIWPLVLMLSVTQAIADARMSVLVDVLKLREAVEILSNEGLDYADTLNQDMLDGEGGAGWQVQVGAIYDPERMVERVRSALSDEVTGGNLEEAISFFAAPLGTKIIELENSARVALQDEDIEVATRARYAELKDSDDPRMKLIFEYVETGDMLNRNVASALNSNVQFMQGLVDGKMLDMTEDQILSDVSADLEEVRADSAGWLYGFLLMAYHPLDDAELRSYIDFSRSDAGKALNTALFSGFGAAYEDISYALGRAVARNITAKEL